MIERRGKLKQKINSLMVEDDYIHLVESKQDPDRTQPYQTKYCTFEMSQNDLKNIKSNQEDINPLSQYLNRTE